MRCIGYSYIVYIGVGINFMVGVLRTSVTGQSLESLPLGHSK